MKKTKIILSLAGLTTVSTVLGPVLTSCSSSSVLIKFETNGGSTIDSQRIKKGGYLEKPTDPTKDGYDFGGWYTDEALTTEFDFTQPVEKSMTLYARWTDGQVTANQWSNAFNYVSNTLFANKNFTLDATYIVGDVTQTYKILCGTNVYKQTFTDLSVSTTTNLWEEFIDKSVLSTMAVGESKTTTFGSTSAITAFLTGWFAPFTNMFSIATYNQSTRTYTISDVVYGNINIKFDSNANISSFVCSYSAAGVRYSISAVLSNYGTTEVTDAPENSKIVLSSDNFIAGDKQTASTNFSLTSEHLFIVSLPISKLVNFDSTRYTYAKFGDSNVKYKTGSTPNILADGTTLTMGTDFTYSDTLISINPDKLENVSILSMTFLANIGELKEIFTNFNVYQN